MSSDLVQELNSLRIKHGTSNVYKALLSMMRREYEELSEIFGCGTNITGSCQNSNPIVPASDYYNEFMFLNNRAMAETLEEQCYNLHEVDLETISQDEDVDLEIDDDVEVEDNMDIGFYGFGEAGLGEADADVKIICTDEESPSEDTASTPDIKEIITEPHPIVKGRGKRMSKKKD